MRRAKEILAQNRGLWFLGLIGCVLQVAAFAGCVIVNMGFNRPMTEASLIAFGLAMTGFLCITLLLACLGVLDRSLRTIGLLLIFAAASLGFGLGMSGVAKVLAFTAIVGSMTLGGLLVYYDMVRRRRS